MFCTARSGIHPEKFLEYIETLTSLSIHLNDGKERGRFQRVTWSEFSYCNDDARREDFESRVTRISQVRLLSNANSSLCRY